MIKKLKGKFCVFNHAGTKQVACHTTKKAAVKQLRAIEANKKKRK